MKEFQNLLFVYKVLNPKASLEIGVKNGGTLWNWIQHARPDARIVALDDCRQVDASNEAQKWGADLDFHFVVGDSHNLEIAETVNYLGPYDFVFIDGDHTYDGVRRDWELYGYASIVAFHDIVPHKKPEDNGASQLWSEIKDYYTTQEFVEDWDADFGGIGVIFMLQ